MKKLKMISMLAIMALLVVGAVFAVSAASDSVEVSAESCEAGIEGGCNYYCPWCPGTGYSCDSGGDCC